MWFSIDTRQRAASYQIHKGKSIYFYCGLYSGINLDYAYQVWKGTKYDYTYQVWELFYDFSRITIGIPAV